MATKSQKRADEDKRRTAAASRVIAQKYGMKCTSSGRCTIGNVWALSDTR